ncbi:MAG: GEVED domain-containing protein, partial [Candidatus Kapaibacterium sp.]
MNAVPNDYPYMGDEIITTTNPPVYPGRIVHRYWRLSKPVWSTFVRGTRNFDIRSEYRDSEDWEALDSYECADFAFNTYFDDTTRDTTNWESIWPSNGGICTDTRDMTRTPSFANTFGNGTAGNVFTDVNNITKSWGSTKTLPNNALLLGDFVLGNQNGKAQFITFYSRQSGNWTDPNTWSTVGHLSNINVADTISPTINFRKFPIRQYDNVLIDSNHKVTLNASIGMGEYTANGTPARYLAKVGPNVVVKPKGILDLDIFDLRGNSFKAEKGATLIIGSSEGVSQTSPVAVRGLGNLKGYARAIEDSVNLVYSAEGVNPDNPNRSFPYYHNYCTINMGDNSRYIRRVTVSQGATTIMNNNTGDSLINILSFHDYVAELTAGQTYTLEVEKEDNTNTRYLRAFIDWNRNGVWTDAGETIANQNFPNNSTTTNVNFTVPASTPEGSTQMRVIYRSNSTNTDPCTNSNGEAEDYTIVVRNAATNISQNMGNLVPNTINSLTIHSPRPTSQVNVSQALNIVDSLKFTSGVLNANGNDISLAGDIIVDTLNPYNQGASTLTFYKGKDQKIRGNNAVTLGAVTINKDSNDVFINTNTTFAGNTAVTSQTLINIENSDTLTFGNASVLTSGAGGFGLNRMIKVSGTPTLSGVVSKQFNNAAGNQSFTYPIGTDTLYNPGFITIDGTYTGIPAISVQLNNAKHPARRNDLILNKYWTVASQNITSLNASEFKFFYNIPADTNGNAPRYYAGLYRPSNEWEVNLGTSPSAFPDTIKATNTLYYLGDWTAGESSTFFNGRNYYSRITGDWNVPLNWSNVGHAGPPSSYSPGELSQSDTVFIDGHTIAFNIDTVTVDIITIGGAFNGASTAGRGILNFAAAPLDKHMTIQRSLFLDTDGRIQTATQLGKVDTLSIFERLINNGTAANTSGIDLYNSTNDFVFLNFRGSTDSYIEGTGAWEGLSKVNLLKAGGLSDTLFINSATLGAASSSFVDYGFNLQSGVLKHYNNYDFVAGNDGLGINMDQFTGIVVTDGRLISKETVNTDVDNTIEILGGEFVVGDEIDENFIYQDNTLVRLNGGKMTVAGAFDGDFLGATLRLNIENNSQLKVLDLGATDIGLIGLNVNAGSQLDMSSGRIIIANAIPGANADYRVNSAVGTGFTGGIVQIGDSTSSVGGSEIKVIGSTPIFDLHVVGNTITAKQTGASISIKNNLEIDNNAEYDVSTNSLSVAGNITNYGLFDASNGNIADFRLLTLNGTGDQTIFNDDAPGMSLHNLTIDKTSGKVILSGSGNSNLQVHRNLEFTAGNNAFIDGSANQFTPFVEVSPLGGTNPAIIRNGKGHVYGRLYRYFTANATERVYAVGSDTIDSYRPALIKTVNNGNTAGLIGVAHYGVDHPDLDPAVMNTALNIQKYWNVNTNGFALGAGNTYELRLDFLNPADIRNSANTNFFEQFMYDPACPAPPGLCPA